MVLCGRGLVFGWIFGGYYMIVGSMLRLIGFQSSVVKDCPEILGSGPAATLPPIMLIFEM